MFAPFLPMRASRATAYRGGGGAAEGTLVGEGIIILAELVR
jgi:hypothetical protein